MRGMSVIAAAAIGFGAVAAAAAADSNGPSADQPTPLTAPPLSGTTSSDLGRSGGVIAPPADVDPQMRRMPPPSGIPCRRFHHRERPAATHRSNQNSVVRLSGWRTSDLLSPSRPIIGRTRGGT